MISVRILGVALAVCVAVVWPLPVDAGQDGTGAGLLRLFTTTQAQRGARIYASRCESCHGPDLSGGKVVPGVAGDAFFERWNGRPLGDLLNPVIASMPPDDPSSLSLAQRADVLAFLLSANGWPAGPRELTPDAGGLGRVRFQRVAAGDRP